MKRKAYTLMAFFFLAATTSSMGNTDSAMLRKMSDEILLRGTCYENLYVLTKKIGNRLSGSAAADKAVEWGKTALAEAGADSVWLQPVDVPVWTRGEEWLEVQLSRAEYISLPMLSLGNTDGTNGRVLEKEIVCVPSLEEFEQLKPEQVKDRIVFFNYKFRQDLINTFDAYGDAVRYRWVAVNKAALKGASAVIIRSVGSSINDVPHTGSSRYNEDVPHIPAVAIGNQSADRLAKSCAKKTVRARLLSNCKMNGWKRSYNVIGEIRGKANPSEYIVAGGHLDSWDVGEGAHDDGAGCVQAIEVIRTIKALGIPTNRSIRAVLFMNEENGVKGGTAYADSAQKLNEKHILAIESDAGGFVPRGIGLDMNGPYKIKVQSWKSLFLPYGVYDFDQTEGGVDIGPLKKLGVPLAGLIPDSQRYFDLHHSANDILEAVSHRELKIGAWTMVSLVYLADKYF